MEEFFLHLWDEYDDLVGACRHVGVCTVNEFLAVAPELAAGAAALLTVAVAAVRLLPVLAA